MWKVSNIVYAIENSCNRNLNPIVFYEKVPAFWILDKGLKERVHAGRNILIEYIPTIYQSCELLVSPGMASTWSPIHSAADTGGFCYSGVIVGFRPFTMTGWLKPFVMAGGLRPFAVSRGCGRVAVVSGRAVTVASVEVGTSVCGWSRFESADTSWQGVGVGILQSRVLARGEFRDWPTVQ
jgi:hypothetical protein